MWKCWSTVQALSMLICLTSVAGYEKSYCPISLPQNVHGVCGVRRQTGLALQKSTYQLNPPKEGMPYARLNVTMNQYKAFLADKPFLASHAQLYSAMGKGVRSGSVLYQQMTKLRPDEMTVEDYIEMYGFYRSFLEKAFGHKMRLPSKYEFFQMDATKYLSDKLFAEQRLAGSNPFTLQRVTLSNTVGLNWYTLRKTLNPEFDWGKAIRNAIDPEDKYLENVQRVVKKRLLYVLRYPLCDDIPFNENIVVKNPYRTMWPFLSPIALFALTLDDAGDTQLVPVAIQMDYKKESKVYTPKDGSNWTLAKLNVQVTDLGLSQMVDHLSSTHYMTEAVCVSMERHLSHRHPLYAMLQFHCRGVLTANTLGSPSLFSPTEFPHSLYAWGWKGGLKLVTGASELRSWQAVDFDKDIKRRGVKNQPDGLNNLQYYPYRDDGSKVAKAINSYVEDYVRLYYSGSKDVEKDNELQDFVKEISIEGNGKIRGFPTRVSKVLQLRTILSRFIWIVSGRHAAVSYSMENYASYVPNSPTRLYHDKRAPPGEFSLLNLPQKSVANMQASELTSLLATLRYDQLFDYGDLLEDRAAREVVKRHYCQLDELEVQLVEANEWRYKNGQLTYPYFLPRRLTNSVQT